MVDWYLPPEFFVPRRISTSFYVGWPAPAFVLGPAGKPKRADVPPPDATHQNVIELNAQPARHTLPRTTTDAGTSKPAPEHVLTFPLGRSNQLERIL